jgi:hypothetical protein
MMGTLGRLILWSVCLTPCLFGCVTRSGWVVDASLPEAQEEVVKRSPRGVLWEAAEVDEPSVRGRAIELLIRHDASPGGGKWAQRGLYDPDPWIQRKAVLALSHRLDEAETRQLLSEYLERSDVMVNTYSQGFAGLTLLKAGRVDAVEPSKDRWKMERERSWRAAPLALTAAYAGDVEAQDYLAEVLRAADLPLEGEFLLDVGRSGILNLIPALSEGSDQVEEELFLAYAAARWSLGDVGGQHVLRRALNDEEIVIRLEALDWITQLPDMEDLLHRASNQKNPKVRWYGELALISRGKRPVERLSKAILHEDREVRIFAMKYAATVVGSKAERIAREVIAMGLVDEDPIVRIESLKSGVILNTQWKSQQMNASLADEVLAVRVEAAGAALAVGFKSPQSGE